MKNKIFTSIALTFVFFSCLCSSKAFANTYCCTEPTYETPFVNMTVEKHYIAAGNIVFAENSLYLLMKGHLIPINCVEADEGGVFIRPQAYEFRTCPVCGYPLYPWGTCPNEDCPTNN